MAASIALVLAACGTDTDAPETEPDIGVDQPDDDPAPPSDDPAEPGDVADDPDDPAEDEDVADEPEGEVAMLDGEVSTGTSEDDGDGTVLAVTDVRVGTHDGFDRIVFDIEGDGLAGWNVRYEDEPTSQGSGRAIEVEGDTALAVAIHSVALPPELPEDVEHWDEGPFAGPDGGVVLEVVSDTIFEGYHTFAIGMTDELPFLVERLEDPQRIVIDVAHDG